MASDADNLYCVVPNFSFDPTPNYGVYRVDKRRGEAVLLWRPSAARDQPEVAVEGADLYVASSADGVIYRFDKASGKRAAFLRDSVALTRWRSMRRMSTGTARGPPMCGVHRGRAARKIEVVGRKVDDARLVAHASGVYWFEGGPGRTGYRLMRLSPGAAAAIAVAKDLNMPAGLTVDETSVYVGDVVGQRIVRLPRCSAPQSRGEGAPHCIPSGEPHERATF